MRGLVSIAFLLSAGGAADAQSFSFNAGGQSHQMDVRGYCTECGSATGYVQYGRTHYYDYEIPYVGRRPAKAPRAAQAQKRKPDAGPVVAQPIALPAAASPAAPPVSALPPALKPSATAAIPAAPPPAIEPPQTAAAPAPPAVQELAATEPAKPAAESASPTRETATPSPPEPAAEMKPAVMAALPPKHDAEARPKLPGNSPFGVWSSSDGQMRVEPCGKSICSYAVGGQHAGKMILRYMRPAGDSRWAGQVTDIRSGQVYSASMSMRGPNALNIQGCALGGLVCGGQTFTRAR